MLNRLSPDRTGRSSSPACRGTATAGRSGWTMASWSAWPSGSVRGSVRRSRSVSGWVSVERSGSGSASVRWSRVRWVPSSRRASAAPSAPRSRRRPARSRTRSPSARRRRQGSSRRWRPRTRSDATKATTNRASAPDVAGVIVRVAATRRERFGGAVRAAQVARAVDVRARQADELLLAERLGDRFAQGGAAVRRIVALRPERRAIVLVDRAQERADPVPGRPFVSRRPRATPWTVAPGRRRWSTVDRCMRRQAPSLDRRTRALPLPRGWNGAESSTFRVLP